MHKNQITNTSQSSFSRPRTLHVSLHQRRLVPLVFLRPGPSPGAWAPTSFLSRADQVSLSLVNAARSSSGDITITKQLINGIKVYMHWRHTLSPQAVAVQSNTYKDTFLTYLPSWMVIAGKWHQSTGRRNSLSPPIAVQPSKSPIKEIKPKDP